MWGKAQLRRHTGPNGNHSMCRCVNTPYYYTTTIHCIVYNTPYYSRYCWHCTLVWHPDPTNMTHPVGGEKHFYSFASRHLEFYPVTKIIPKRWSFHWCLFQHTHSISPEVNDDFSCWLSLKQAPLYSTRLLNSTCINTVGLQFNPHICYCPTHWKLFDKFTIYLHSFHLINSIYTVFAHIGYLTWYLNWAGTSAHIRIAKN